VDSETRNSVVPIPRIGIGRGVRQLREVECVQLLRVIRWPGPIECPHCSSTEVIRTGRHQAAYHRYRCKTCRRIFNEKTGTIFEGSRQPLKVWFLAAFLQRGKSIREVSSSLGMGYDTTHRMVALLRESGAPDLIASGLSHAVAVHEGGATGREEAEPLLRPFSIWSDGDGLGREASHP
jgi:transposase-like protein